MGYLNMHLKDNTNSKYVDLVIL